MVNRVEALAEAFIARTLPKTEWTHYAHLKVGLWHLLNYSESKALEKLRSRIREYNVACGVENTETTGYHETITRFYLLLIQKFLERSDILQPLDMLAERLIEDCGDNRLIFSYYTPEILFSKLARSQWVKPDLLPLD